MLRKDLHNYNVKDHRIYNPMIYGYLSHDLWDKYMNFDK